MGYLQDPIYGVQLYYSFCHPNQCEAVLRRFPAAASTHLIENGWLDGEAAGGRIIIHDRYDAAFIWINRQQSQPAIRRAITHEALHATLWVLARVGVELHTASHEAFTYYHGWATEALQAQMRTHD